MSREASVPQGLFGGKIVPKVVNLSESTTVDRKGRLLIPRRIREAAGIKLPTRVLAIVRGVGRLDLVVVDPDLKRAREVARKKLSGWSEEEHEPEKLALKLVSQEN